MGVEDYKTSIKNQKFLQMKAMLCHECYFFLSGFSKRGGNNVISYNLYHRKDFIGTGNLCSIPLLKQKGKVNYFLKRLKKKIRKTVRARDKRRR